MLTSNLKIDSSEYLSLLTKKLSSDAFYLWQKGDIDHQIDNLYIDFRLIDSINGVLATPQKWYSEARKKLIEKLNYIKIPNALLEEYHSSLKPIMQQFYAVKNNTVNDKDNAANTIKAMTNDFLEFFNNQLDTFADVIKIYDNKLIFADYRRFDQKGPPIDETHGGASLEEWLVPVFIIDNTAVRKETVKIKIIVPADSLRPDAMTKMVTVRFSLENHRADNVSVRIHGKKIVCRCMESYYEFKYKPEKNENSVSANVYVNSDNIGDFKFTIKQGISKNSIFDLL